MKSFGVGLSIFFLLYPVARIEAETFSPPSDVPFGLMRSKAEKAGSDSPSSHFESVIEGEDFESFIAEHGIERSGRGASYLLLKAEEALSDNKDAEAIRLGEMAKIIAPDSPMPPFFLAKAYAYANPLNIANPISNFFVGLGRMMDDVFLLLSILSPFLLLLLPSVVLSLLTFTIFSITSYASVWIHQLTESSRGYLHPISALFLFVALIFLPLILGLPFWWFVYFSFLLFWRYYKRNEKGVVFSFLFVIGCSAWLLPFFITLYTVNAGPLFQEMSRNHKADHFWIPPKEPSNPSGWETWFISASREAKQGNHEKAAQLYQRALEQNPDSPMILNNLGNISFYQKEFDHAIAYYQAAIDLDASLISSHYNLSQTYRERLLFVKGEKIYSEAVAISPKTVDKYSKISARFPNFPVIEERIGSADLWRWFLREMDHRFYPSERVWKSWVGPFPLGQAPLLAGLSILLLVLAT
ncbi:MAG: tetratricopeptide repeat protein, partial [bacterium]